MGKMKELAEQVTELKKCGEILIGISETLTEMFSAADIEKPIKDEPKPESAEKRPLTLEEVRAVLARRSRDGHTEEVKAVISRFGADKLSAIDPSQYEELLKKVEMI